MSTAEYWKAHTALVEEIKKLGIYHDPRYRLDLAYYRHYLPKLSQKYPTRLVELIDRCIVLRRSGHESAHKDGRYV